MKRLLVIPAAGRGSRLGWDGPKALCPVAGRPMIDHLFERYRPLVDRFIVVVAPDAAALMQQHVATVEPHADCVLQAQPIGMLPAILCARSLITECNPNQVWITWCDQIAISEHTATRLATEFDHHAAAAMAFPTVHQEPPYIHFARDLQGHIVNVLQRREGDPMPPIGESDTGLFALRREAYLGHLVEYDQLSSQGTSTGEKNFLPFIPWLAARADVHTFDLADAMEAVGVNTPGERDAVERYLREPR
jgi:bifunctional UDP-N-acetylglucosamine pyrophosphorylase / glucosamine-1-phosphate N-acetyltransferase